MHRIVISCQSYEVLVHASRMSQLHYTACQCCSGTHSTLLAKLWLHDNKFKPLNVKPSVSCGGTSAHLIVRSNGAHNEAYLFVMVGLACENAFLSPVSFQTSITLQACLPVVVTHLIWLTINMISFPSSVLV